MENSVPSTCESRPRRFSYLLILLMLVLLVGAGVMREVRQVRATPDNELYQVVLLNNDQAFFGKLHDIRGPFPYLTDVYYLKPAAGQTDQAGNPLSAGQSYSVIKRGPNEIHAPTDKLYLNAKNILYWENVGADSLVMKGIKADKEYRATGKAPADVPVIPTPAPQAEVPAAEKAPVATATPAAATTTPAPATK